VRIAILEDEPAQAEMVKLVLEGAGHDCVHFSKGRDFLCNVISDTYDLLIMDWNVPDLDGTEVLDSIRTNVDRKIPVLFTTSRSSEEDIVYALEKGADDYMVKPLKANELTARVNALFRRSVPDDKEVSEVKFSPYTFSLINKTVTYNGTTVELSKKEFDVAMILFRNHGKLISRSYLMTNVWGHKIELNTRTVDSHISKIRKKLNINPDNGWRICSVYQHGYRLENSAED